MADHPAQTSAAFTSNDPEALAARTIELLLTPGREYSEDGEHLLGRVESLITDWIVSGQTERLGQWCAHVRGSGKSYLTAVLAQRSIDESESLGLHTAYLAKFAERFVQGHSQGKLVAMLLAPKRANWRRGLSLMAQAERPWTKQDFQEKVGLGRSGVHDALDELIQLGVIALDDGGHGLKQYHLTPAGWQVVRQLARQGLVGPEASQVQIEAKQPAKMTEHSYQYQLPKDIVRLLFSEEHFLPMSEHRHWSFTSALGRSSRLPGAAEANPLERKPDYGDYFQHVLGGWFRGEVKIGSNLVHFCRDQVSHWARREPEYVLNSMYPAVVAAASPDVFRRIVRLYKRWGKAHQHREERVILLLACIERDEEPKGSWAEHWSKLLPTNLRETFTLQVLPSIAREHRDRRRIKGSEFTTVMDYYEELMRHDYPEDLRVDVSVSGPALSAATVERESVAIVRVKPPAESSAAEATMSRIAASGAAKLSKAAKGQGLLKRSQRRYALSAGGEEAVVRG